MKHIHISGPTAINAMLEAVKERGEGFLYTDMFGDISCEYLAPTKDDSVDGERIPACLVGVALTKIDPDLREWLWFHNSDNVWRLTEQEDWLSFPEKADEARPRIAPFDQVVEGGIRVTMDEDAIFAFGVAQDRQDMGYSWGRALANAQEALS